MRRVGKWDRTKEVQKVQELLFLANTWVPMWDYEMVPKLEIQ